MVENVLSKFRFAALGVLAGLLGCASVDKADLAAWTGQSVVALENHPFFAALPLVMTQTSDGTALRHYVEGANLGPCLGHRPDTRGMVDYSSYTEVASCLERLASCGHVFALRDGRVVRYAVAATGGAVCRTNESMRPRAGAPAPAR